VVARQRAAAAPSRALAYRIDRGHERLPRRVRGGPTRECGLVAKRSRGDKRTGSVRLGQRVPRAVRVARSSALEGLGVRRRLCAAGTGGCDQRRERHQLDVQGPARRAQGPAQARRRRTRARAPWLARREARSCTAARARRGRPRPRRARHRTAIAAARAARRCRTDSARPGRHGRRVRLREDSLRRGCTRSSGPGRQPSASPRSQAATRGSRARAR
jgi:hypothetical protein